MSVISSPLNVSSSFYFHQMLYYSSSPFNSQQFRFRVSIAMNQWITVLNILLFLFVLVASLSIPQEMDEDDAMFIGDADDDDRKNKFNLNLQKHFSLLFFF